MGGGVGGRENIEHRTSNFEHGMGKGGKMGEGRKTGRGRPVHPQAGTPALHGSGLAEGGAEGFGGAGLADEASKDEDGDDVGKYLDELDGDGFLAPEDDALES